MDNHLQSGHIGTHSFTAQLGPSTITGLDWWTGLVDWTGGDEKIVKKIVHCSI